MSYVIAERVRGRKLLSESSFDRCNPVSLLVICLVAEKVQEMQEMEAKCLIN